MRFSCEKCSAKYTIADEKVRGKVVAVKCSKCGNRITVNGKSLEPEEEEPPEESTRVASLSDIEALRANASGDSAPAAAAPPPAAPPAPAPRAPEPVAPPPAPGPRISDGWYAIVDGEQLGPLSPEEALGHLDARRIDAQTFMWRDGQADWKRAEEIDEVSALLAPSAPPPPAPPPAPEPPAPAPAPAVSAPPLDDLLFDEGLDGSPTMTGRPIDVASLVANDLDGLGGPADDGPLPDPFSAVPDNPNISKPGEIGEQTRFFMNKAGVTRRNPWWKVALVVVLFVVLPVSVLYLLSQMKIVQLEITQVDETTGEEVKTPVFSADGLSGLRDMLLGGQAATVKRTGRKPGPKRPQGKKPEGRGDGEGAIVAKPQIDFNLPPDQRAAAEALYRDGDRKLAAPVVHKDRLDGKQTVDGQAGLDAKVVGEVVSKNLRAFQICTETEMRRNPTFAGGKIRITVTIGSSGIVTSATIDKRDIDGSDLGACLKEKAKRIVFPSFQGEAFDAEIPLVLTAGG